MAENSRARVTDDAAPLPASPAPSLHELAPGPFRQAAVAAHREETEPVEPLLAIDASSWSVVLACMGVVLALLLGALFGHVEVSVTSDGVLRAPSGLHPLRSRLNGVLTEVAVSPGALVQAGATVAVLDSTELLARRKKLEERLQGQREKSSREQALADQLHEKRMKGLEAVAATLRARLDLKRRVLGYQGTRNRQLTELQGVGAVSQHELLGAREANHRTREELLATQERIANLDVEMADRLETHTQSALTRKRALEEAEAELRETDALIAQTQIRAPQAGRVESLNSTPGQVVEQGGVIAQLVPLDALRTAIVFVPAEDVSFVTPGQPAFVEFPSLSISEFGAAPASVARVSSDVATPEEVTAALGTKPGSPQNAMFRVELQLKDSSVLERVRPHLRSGTVVRARLQTRTRRIASLLFDVVHNWLYR